jgi:hypothetical protein
MVVLHLHERVVCCSIHVILHWNKVRTSAILFPSKQIEIAEQSSIVYKPRWYLKIAYKHWIEAQTIPVDPQSINFMLSRWWPVFDILQVWLVLWVEWAPCLNNLLLLSGSIWGWTNEGNWSDKLT